MYIMDNNKVLLYSRGNYIQHPVINHNGKAYEKECVCVYIYIHTRIVCVCVYVCVFKAPQMALMQSQRRELLQ